MAFLRLALSAILAFSFYASWAYYANSLVTADKAILLKAALVQGTYSGGITLFFTFLLEYFHTKFGHSAWCVSLIVPRWSKDSDDEKCQTKEAVEDALASSQQRCSGNYLPGMLLVPIPALLVQCTLLITVNVLFATPNLWLTIAPSIVFSAIYGYLYSVSLSKSQARSKLTNS
jgi:hypothetical protein